MIKLSKLTDYAVVVLAAMACHGIGQEQERLSASGLAEITNLPEPTVSKILKMLAKGGVITSARGVNGGYALNTTPAKTMVSDIITAMEGPIALTSCVKDSNDSCSLEGLCMMHGRWNVVNAALKTALDNVTLADMMPPAGARPAPARKGKEERTAL